MKDEEEMQMRQGDSVVIDPVTRKVTHLNGEPCDEMTPELEALVEEHLGPPSPAKKEGTHSKPRRGEEVDI